MTSYRIFLVFFQSSITTLVPLTPLARDGELRYEFCTKANRSQPAIYTTDDMSTHVAPEIAPDDNDKQQGRQNEQKTEENGEKVT